MIADDAGGRVARRHHGRRRAPRCPTTRATSTSRRRSGGPRRSPAARAATTSRPTPAIASSAASIRRTTVEHIERITQLIVDDLRRRGRARWTTRSSRCRERKPVTLRVDARRQGDRHAGDAGAMRRRVRSAWACRSPRQPGTSDGHAAELALRPADRGRPDRGGDPRASATTRCPTTPPLAPVTRARAPRGAAQRRTRCASAMAALGYQETINFSFVEERWERELAGNADPIRVLNPIAAPLAVMRSSLLGSLVERAALQPGAQGDARARVRDRPRVPARRRRAPTATRRVAGMRQPMRVGGPGLRPARRRCSGASQERAVDFFDVKGDVEALLAPRAARFVAGRASGAASGPLRARRARRRARSASSASCIRAGARPTSCRSAPVLFELDARRAAAARRCRRFEPLPRQQSAWRDIARGRRRAVTPRRADAAHRAARRRGLVRSATLFDIYKPAQPSGRHRRRRAQPGGAARAARRRGHADRRAHRRASSPRVRRRAGRSASARACAA